MPVPTTTGYKQIARFASERPKQIQPNTFHLPSTYGIIGPNDIETRARDSQRGKSGQHNRTHTPLAGVEVLQNALAHQPTGQHGCFKRNRAKSRLAGFALRLCRSPAWPSSLSLIYPSSFAFPSGLGAPCGRFVDGRFQGRVIKETTLYPPSRALPSLSPPSLSQPHPSDQSQP